jgi:hypothetical protein
MAFKAAEATAKALREHGPAILRTKHTYGYDAKTKKSKTEDRLQMAPDNRHQGDDDPHKNGRALDIVLLASSPAERAEADEVVLAFLALRETMSWGAVIYNKEEWNSAGGKTPRLSNDPDRWEKARFEHVTHIHIEWPDHKKDDDGFYDDLAAELERRRTKVSAIDALNTLLPGRWNVWIGDKGSGWNGIFRFTAGGGATWASLDTPNAETPGSWSVVGNELRWRYRADGDFRTFVAPLPLKSEDTPGHVLPAGQGWFSMSKL